MPPALRHLPPQHRTPLPSAITVVKSSIRCISQRYKIFVAHIGGHGKTFLDREFSRRDFIEPDYTLTPERLVVNFPYGLAKPTLPKENLHRKWRFHVFVGNQSDPSPNETIRDRCRGRLGSPGGCRLSDSGNFHRFMTLRGRRGGRPTRDGPPPFLVTREAQDRNDDREERGGKSGDLHPGRIPRPLQTSAPAHVAPQARPSPGVLGIGPQLMCPSPIQLNRNPREA